MRELFDQSLVHDLIRKAGNISVHVIAGDDMAESNDAPGTSRGGGPARHRPRALHRSPGGSGGGARHLPPVSAAARHREVDLVFLTAIIGIAVRYGLWPSVAACVAASLCYNFFFLPPVHTFTITEPTNIAAFVMFTLVSVIVSNLAARGRADTVAAQERVRSLELLYGFSRKLAGAGTLDDVLWATAFQIASMLKVRSVVLLPKAGEISVRAGYPPEDQLDELDLAAAKWAWDQNQVAGRDFDTLPGARWLFLPMRTGRGAMGIVGITRDGPDTLLSAGQRPLLDALVNQGALAIERVHLVEDIERVDRLAETDRLRTALLTSISHDLRTPLAAILGQPARFGISTNRSMMTPRPTCSPPSSRNRNGSTASSPICST